MHLHNIALSYCTTLVVPVITHNITLVPSSLGPNGSEVWPVELVHVASSFSTTAGVTCDPGLDSGEIEE